MTGDAIGYVYIMRTDDDAPLKIGFTLGSIVQRESELFQTGMPKRLQAIYHATVTGPMEVEQAVHADLEVYRISQNREFFSCSAIDAIAAIQKTIKTLGRPILAEWAEPKFDTFSNDKIAQLELRKGWPQSAQPVIQDLCKQVVSKAKLLAPQWEKLWRERPAVKDGKYENLDGYRTWSKSFTQLMYNKIADTELKKAKHSLENTGAAESFASLFAELSSTIADVAWKETEKDINLKKIRGVLEVFSLIDDNLVAIRRAEFDKDDRIKFVRQKLYAMREAIGNAAKFFALPCPILDEPSERNLKTAKEYIENYMSNNYGSRFFKSHFESKIKKLNKYIEQFGNDQDCLSKEDRVNAIWHDHTYVACRFDEHIDEYANDLIGSSLNVL